MEGEPHGFVCNYGLDVGFALVQATQPQGLSEECEGLVFAARAQISSTQITHGARRFGGLAAESVFPPLERRFQEGNCSARVTSPLVGDGEVISQVMCGRMVRTESQPALLQT